MGVYGWAARTKQYYVWYTTTEILFGKKRNGPPTGARWLNGINDLRSQDDRIAQFKVDGVLRTLTFLNRADKNRFLEVCTKPTETPVAKPNRISEPEHSTPKKVKPRFLKGAFQAPTADDLLDRGTVDNDL